VFCVFIQMIRVEFIALFTSIYTMIRIMNQKEKGKKKMAQKQENVWVDY